MAILNETLVYELKREIEIALAMIEGGNNLDVIGGNKFTRYWGETDAEFRERLISLLKRPDTEHAKKP